MPLAYAALNGAEYKTNTLPAIVVDFHQATTFARQLYTRTIIPGSIIIWFLRMVLLHKRVSGLCALKGNVPPNCCCENNTIINIFHTMCCSSSTPWMVEFHMRGGNATINCDQIGEPLQRLSVDDAVYYPSIPLQIIRLADCGNKTSFMNSIKSAGAGISPYKLWQLTYRAAK